MKPNRSRLTLVASSVIGILLLAFTLSFWLQHSNPNSSASKVAEGNHSNQLVQTNAELVGAPVREWIKGKWDTNSFESGRRFASEGDPRTHALAFEKIFSKRDSLTVAELMDFKRMLERQIRATSDNPFVVASAIRTLAGLFDYLKVRGLATDADIAAYGESLVQYLQKDDLDLQIRGAAIRATGDLGIASGRAPIEKLLADTANLNTAEITRNGCLALVKLANQEAFVPVRDVLVKTSDSAIFGTAAYCLGQINTTDAMSALVENSRKFPDSASCDAALVNMEKVILDALSHPERPQVLNAIQATEHLWKDGQREKYVAALRGLLSNSPPAVRKASCERLVEVAGQLPFAQEKQELSKVLDSIGQSPELADSSEKIRRRMGATVLSPIADATVVPTQRKE